MLEEIYSVLRHLRFEGYTNDDPLVKKLMSFQKRLELMHIIIDEYPSAPQSEIRKAISELK